MERKTVVAGLRAYKHIEDDIRQKLMFAREAEDDRQLLKEADELRNVRREIIRCLNDLPQLERDCIWRHYIQGERWVRICQKYAYSERQIRNISNRGLNRLGSAFSKRANIRRFCAAAETWDT